MTNLFTAKTNFTAGELSPDLLGRVDLTSYNNGAQILENVFIEPTRGIHRRPGLQYIATLSGKGRLISYEEDSTSTYLFIIQHNQTLIYKNDTLYTTLSTPWQSNQLTQICWTAITDGLIIVHPDVAPQRFTLNNGTWSVGNFQFLSTDNYVHQPYHRFGADHITIAASASTGTTNLTASADLFASRHLNQTMKLGDGYVQITAITDTQHATATVLKKLSEEDSLDATRYWGEVAWNTTHGWPISVATYQQRLVFGGSKKLPNTLWFSQTDDMTNFEEGEALDNEAITFSLTSDESNKICSLFAGRHLQIFTTSAEWMVTGDPLAPGSIQLRRQTQVGSPDTRYVPPIGIDGATIFAAANGKEIREFLFSDLEGIYQATDLSLLAHHAIKQPTDMVYDKYRRQAYIIMQDGTLSALTSFRSEDMQSWTRHKTNGSFLYAAASGQNTYFLTQRNNVYYLEKLSDQMYMDMATTQTSITPTNSWGNLAYLNGFEVRLLADGRVQENQTVSGGSVTLNISATELQAGLAFTHKVAPLPAAGGANNGPAPVSSCRFVRGVFRLINTKSFQIDTGTGLHQEMVNNLSNYTLDSAPGSKTTDIIVRGLGWKRNPTVPLWLIQGDQPLPFQLVSVTSDIKIGE